MGACKHCGAKYLNNVTRMSYHLRLQCKKISDVEKKHVIQLYSKEHPSPSVTTSDHPGTSMDVGNNPNISSNDLDEFQRQADSLLTKFVCTGYVPLRVVDNQHFREFLSLINVVVATNIAETSLTIDGIYYVVNPGFVKQKIYNPKSGMDSLVVTPISQAAAQQRAGRAGRTDPGKCYRLYTERAFRDEMLPTPIPEIQRTNLAHTLLQLKAMDFMDAPPVEAMLTALQQLFQLSALDEDGLLTRLGRRMAEFPLDPALAKLLIMSVDLACSDEVLTIVSMLSLANQAVFYRPKERQEIADEKKSKFHQPEGDHCTLLAVYNSWKHHHFSPSWCYENFLQVRSLKRAQDIRKQLLGIMDRHKLDMVSCGRDVLRIQKAICSGFFRNSAKRDPQEGYRTLVDGQTVYIHPSSSMFQNQPEWVVYHELVMTTKEYMREVTVIDPKWLIEYAPSFFKLGDSTKLSAFKRNQKIDPLFNKYEDPNAWRLSRLKKKIYNPNR
uniref:RNA helicase n=1 Tax=Acrobeloides nanus TaxID=290746 RepID=A0A914DSG3_9BILA